LDKKLAKVEVGVLMALTIGIRGMPFFVDFRLTMYYGVLRVMHTIFCSIDINVALVGF
jgi:hypothetical protein